MLAEIEPKARNWSSCLPSSPPLSSQGENIMEAYVDRNTKALLVNQWHKENSIEAKLMFHSSTCQGAQNEDLMGKIHQKCGIITILWIKACGLWSSSFRRLDCLVLYEAWCEKSLQGIVGIIQWFPNEVVDAFLKVLGLHPVRPGPKLITNSITMS